MTGIGPLVRAIAADQRPAVASWPAAVAFIPSLALMLGTVSRTHRLFQGFYMPLWYTVANGLPILDFMGVVRTGGRTAGPPAAAVAGCGLVVLLPAFAARGLRRATA